MPCHILKNTFGWLKAPGGAFLLLACLTASFTACAPLNRQPRFAADLEPYEEAVDTGCSYFHFLWAKSAELSGQFEEAQFAYQQALLCDRKADYVMRNLAMLLIKMGKRRQAIQWIDRIIAENPHDIGARSLLGNLYASVGDQEKAVATYEAILADDPENANVMLMLGSLFVNNKKYDKAQEILEKLVRIHPDSYAGYYYLARLYRELRLFDQALAAYEKALGLNWSAMLAYEAADTYEAAKKYDGAVTLYRRIIEEEVNDRRARGFLANVYIRQGRTDEALEELRQLRKVVDDPERIDTAIGKVLLGARRYDEAARLFSRLLDERPKQEDIRSLLIYALYKKGDAGQARELLRQMAPGGKGYEDAVLMVARMLQDEGDSGAAEALLRENMDDSGRRARNFYVALAMLYREQGEIDKALAVFDQAKKDYPKDVEVLFEYGLFLDRIGNRKAALDTMRRVLVDNPHHAYALNYVGYTWADQGENLKQARVYIEEAASLRPKDGFIRDSLGWVYFRMGRYKQAVAELEKAVELVADDPSILEHLGDAYARSGRPEEAVSAYNQALDLYEDQQKKDLVRRKIEAVGSP